MPNFPIVPPKDYFRLVSIAASTFVAARGYVSLSGHPGSQADLRNVARLAADTVDAALEEANERYERRFIKQRNGGPL